MSYYAIIVRTYLAGTTESASYNSEEELAKAVDSLKQNTRSALVGFSIYRHQESFSKKQVWSSDNG